MKKSGNHPLFLFNSIIIVRLGIDDSRLFGHGIYMLQRDRKCWMSDLRKTSRKSRRFRVSRVLLYIANYFPVESSIQIE